MFKCSIERTIEITSSPSTKLSVLVDTLNKREAPKLRSYSRELFNYPVKYVLQFSEDAGHIRILVSAETDEPRSIGAAKGYVAYFMDRAAKATRIRLHKMGMLSDADSEKMRDGGLWDAVTCGPEFDTKTC